MHPHSQDERDEQDRKNVPSTGYLHWYHIKFFTVILELCDHGEIVETSLCWNLRPNREGNARRYMLLVDEWIRILFEHGEGHIRYLTLEAMEPDNTSITVHTSSTCTRQIVNLCKEEEQALQYVQIKDLTQSIHHSFPIRRYSSPCSSFHEISIQIDIITFISLIL